MGAKNKPDTAEWGAIPELKWMKNTEMERYLGAYLGSTDLVVQQWDKLTEKIENRAKRWHKHHVSILARIIVSKSSLASCMWYMSQCMVTPPGVNEKIQKIINEYVWGKQPRFMGFPEACKPKKLNGLGMLCVESQAAAFSIKSVIRLVTPGKEKWKILPKYWLAKAGAKWELGEKTLTSDVNSQSRLAKEFKKVNFPPFWKQVFKNWFKNQPTIDPTSLDGVEILNQTLWHNPLITHNGATLDMQTLFNQKGPSGQTINGYYRIQDIWDESELNWVDVSVATNHQWIATSGVPKKETT